VAVGALVLLDEIFHEVHSQHAACCHGQGPGEPPDASAQLQNALLLDASKHCQHLWTVTAQVRALDDAKLRTVDHSFFTKALTAGIGMGWSCAVQLGAQTTQLQDVFLLHVPSTAIT